MKVEFFVGARWQDGEGKIDRRKKDGDRRKTDRRDGDRRRAKK